MSALLLASAPADSFAATHTAPAHMNSLQKQVTRNPGGHILTNFGAWSPDSQWLLYDTRSDPAGEKFDGSTIQLVNVETREVKVLYRAEHGSHCGVATFHPREMKVIFILGPERPSADWQYGPAHRQGVIVQVAHPGQAAHLDARDLTSPFTPGALRGGSHVHVWEPAGEWVSFTYEDAVLSRFNDETGDHEMNLRNIGVSVPGHPVRVPKDHPRNHDGGYFSVLATRTTASPKPGSDEIKKAFEEGWVGTNGYVRADGVRQRHALAFQGLVVTAQGQTIAEVFVADLPEDVTVAGERPLEGTKKTRPAPPRGASQRRLTFTGDRKFPGLQGPRHWLRSSPDGERIAFLMKDDAGVAQLWTVSPRGGPANQVTRNEWPVSSAFTWSPDGRWLAHVMDNSVCVSEVATGHTHRLTPRSDDAIAPRPEACVFSPDGKKVAFVRNISTGEGNHNQLFVATIQ